jgi:hypothetical protein
MKPKQGDIVRYIYFDTKGEEIYGLVLEQALDISRILPLWGEAGTGVFRNENLRVVA